MGVIQLKAKWAQLVYSLVIEPQPLLNLQACTNIFSVH